MKDEIKKLQTLREEHEKKSKEYRDAISALQKVCAHKWRYTGHSHNDDHYQCSVCGAEEWR